MPTDPYRLLANGLADRAVVLLDPDGRVTDWNPGAEGLLGYAAADAVGRPLDRLLTPEDVARGDPGRLLGLAAAGRTADTRWLVRADGRRVRVAVTAAALREPDGRLVGFGVAAWDRDDRRAADEARARLAAVVESSEAAVVSTDPDWVVESWNPAAERLFGYTAAEMLGRSILDLVPPDQHPEARRVVEHVRAGGRVAPYEAVRLRKDGTPVHVSVNPWPVRDEAGRFLSLAAVYTDLTDRRRAEAAVREREELLRNVIANIPCGVFWKGRDSAYLGCNDLFARNFGLASPDDVVGRTDTDLGVAPAEAEFFHLCDRTVMQTGRPLLNVEEPLTRLDGTTAVLLTSKVPLRDATGAAVGVLGIYQDITDRKRAEEALRASERHLRAVIETSPECVKLVAPDGTVVEMNRAGLFALEADGPGEMLGRSVLDVIASEDRAAFREMHRAVCGGETRTLEFGMVGLRGGRRRVATHAVPLPGPGGVNFQLGVTRDVTDQRRLEEQLRQAAKLEAVGRLAGGIAHDFNNLLTVINGYGELIRERLPVGDPVRDLVGEMTGAGERAAGLTRQLLAFSRKQVLTPRILDLNEVVGEVGRLLRRLIGEDIDLADRLQPGLGRVRADPGQVEQVLMNLAVNARDAMPTGGKLTIETRDVELDEGYTRTHPGVTPGPHVMLAVSDTGHGMTPEVRARVFEPFFTTKGPGRGTGLGLATVFGVVSQSGGSVEVYSEVGRGTTFKIYLPRVDRPAEGSAVRRLAPPSRGTETLLVAEDEPSVRALTCHVLRAAGYAVVEAGTGAEAVRAAERHGGPIHLLVTDVVMPGMGGREVAERLLVRHPGLRVLYMSGYTDDAVVRHGILEETVEFLPKPFTPAVLAARVREVLDRPR